MAVSNIWAASILSPAVLTLHWAVLGPNWAAKLFGIDFLCCGLDEKKGQGSFCPLCFVKLAGEIVWVDGNGCGLLGFTWVHVILSREVLFGACDDGL